MQENTQKSPLLCNFPCHLIPYGIDLEKFKPNPKVESRKKFGIPSDHKVMVFRDNGYYSDRFKGMKWLMEALQIYEPKEPTSLLILEDGSAFRSLAPKYNIVTPGWIDGEELADALSAGDVFLMPSVQESFGLMAVEAMACGTPVIVCEGTALPNVIQAPKGGLAVRARDGAAIAKAIQRLLHDKDLNETMGRQGRQIAESEYSLSLNAQRHIQVYIEAIDHFVKPQG
jgi:glycosyltransferase involved in cell wall biosynthesis